MWDSALQLFYYFFMLLSLELTQIEDPREQWRREQERMLKEYLIVAQEALNAKKEIYQIKQQRFELAQEEYQQLHKMCEDDSRSYASCEFTSLFVIYSAASLNVWCKKLCEVFPSPSSPLNAGPDYKSEVLSFDSVIQGLLFPVRSIGICFFYH